MSNTFKLRNGRILLSTEAPGGIYNSSQLKKIAALCDGDSVTVKATEDQRLALIVHPEKAAFVASELKSMGLGVRHYQDGLHQPVSCIGELCEFHEQDALGSALDVSAELEGIKLKSPLKIGINGCAKCCVPCHTLDISVVGDSHGYRISLGGKTSQFPEMAGFIAEGIPQTEIARLVRSVVEIYRNNAKEGESLQELIDRDGAKPFIEALAPWSQDASASHDPFESAKTDLPPFEPEILKATQPTETSETGEDVTADESLDPINDSGLNGFEADESLHAIDHDDSDFIAPSSSNQGGDEIVVVRTSETEVPTEIQVPTKSPTLDMDLIMNHGDDLNMKEVQITPVQEALSTPQPSFVEAEVDTDPAPINTEAETQTANQTSDYSALDENTETGYTPEPKETSNEETTEIEAPIPMDHESNISDPVINDEDKIEAKLIASINAQQDLYDTDNLESERAQSTELLENADISIEESQIPPSFQDTDSDFTTAELETQPEIATAVKDNTVSIPHFQPRPKTQKISLQSFDFDESGSPVITWSNGIQLTLTAAAVNEGNIRFCGHNINISQSTDGIRVQVDGISMLLPSAA